MDVAFWPEAEEDVVLVSQSDGFRVRPGLRPARTRWSDVRHSSSSLSDGNGGLRARSARRRLGRQRPRARVSALLQTLTFSRTVSYALSSLSSGFDFILVHTPYSGFLYRDLG